MYLGFGFLRQLNPRSFLIKDNIFTPAVSFIEYTIIIIFWLTKCRLLYLWNFVELEEIL